MVSKTNDDGLIVATSIEISAALDELLVFCDWPVAHKPSVRKLCELLESHSPRCFVFWLDDASDLAHAADLVARLRERGPRPYRLGVAHRLDEIHEAGFRAAGVHGYLSTHGDLRDLIATVVVPLVAAQSEADASLQPVPSAARRTVGSAASVRASPASMRPP